MFCQQQRMTQLNPRHALLVPTSTRIQQQDILVTGSGGFLGARILNLLKKKDPNYYYVKTFDLVDGQDILDAQAMVDAVRGASVVINLAAESNLNFFRVDPVGAQRIIWRVLKSCGCEPTSLRNSSLCLHLLLLWEQQLSPQ